MSKANNKTKRKFIPNIQSVTFRSEILNKNVVLNSQSIKDQSIQEVMSI